MQLSLPWPCAEQGRITQSPLIFTIGHSNHAAESFSRPVAIYIRLEILIDVRSAPFSRYAPHFFSRGSLMRLSRRRRYPVHLGREARLAAARMIRPVISGPVYVRKGNLSTIP